MNLRLRAKRQRQAMSLLEMMIATMTIATLMASVVVLVRSGYGAWDAYEQDIAITDNGYGTLRHIVRRIRQADAGASRILDRTSGCVLSAGSVAGDDKTTCSSVIQHNAAGRTVAGDGSERHA